MNLFDFADVLFNLVESGFTLVGIIALVIAFAISTRFVRFLTGAGDAMAKVVAHENVRRSMDPDGAREICRYQPVFELVGGPHAGMRSLSSEVHSRNSYPIGTVWPARFNPKTGKIRTARDLDAWPMIGGVFWLVGFAFVILPNMGNAQDDVMLALLLSGLGIGSMIGGIVTMIRAKRRSARDVNVLAKFAHIEVAYDSDRDPYDLPVFRISAGDYQGTEGADVDIGRFSKEDVGKVMRARFDPYSGRISLADDRFKGPRMVPALLLTGAIFTVIGYLIYAGVI